MKMIFKFNGRGLRNPDLNDLYISLTKVANEMIGEGTVSIFKEHNCCIKISNKVDTIKNNKFNKYRVYVLIKQLLDNLGIKYEIIKF